MTRNKHLGGKFEDFLKSEGILGEVEAVAIKRVLATQVQDYLISQPMTKTSFAKHIGTSRSQLDRLLETENPSVTLQTMVKAARGMGKKLEITLC
ncbi:MAG: hypothetical protein ACSHWQ_08885 [Spongiibacteraceae bacterium]